MQKNGHKCLAFVSGVYLIDNLQISAKMRHSVRNFVLRFCNHLIINVVCGVREIRTPDTLSGYTNFPGLPLQPLEHHSLLFCGANLGNYYIFYNCFSTKSSNFSAPQAPQRPHISHEGALIGIF